MISSSEKIYCKTGGCGAKLGPAALKRILSKIEQKNDKNLLVGFDSSDDAAVYKLTDDIAVVQTLDFFPPMVDDPYIFGQIAATNALSDIYAMGATFKTALNIVCYPEKEDLNILGKIIEGGSSKVLEAGGSLVGGHSINDTSIKYGLSVVGIVNPKKIYKNNMAQPGDCVILTKPLGVGIICSANNVGYASNNAVEQAIKSMTTLNKYAAEISNKYSVNACTDVTGFGLLAHLFEMLGYSDLQNNNLCAKVKSSNVPYIKQAYDYANDFYITAAGQRNRNFVGSNVDMQIDDFAMEELLFDPQTSGGLLLSVKKEQAQELLSELKEVCPQASIVAEIYERKDLNTKKIIVEN